MELSYGILRYFRHAQNYLKIERNLKNNSFPRWKNTNEIIINHKGTRMVEDGED